MLFSSANDRLRKKLLHQKRQLAITQAMNKLRDSCKTQQELSNQILDFALKSTQAKLGYLVLKNESGDELKVASTNDNKLFSPDFTVVKDLAFRTMELGEYLFINNTKKHPRLKQGKVSLVIAVPIIYKKETMGAMLLMQQWFGKFKKRDLEVIKAVCAHYGSVSDHIKARQDSSQAVKEISTLYAIDKLKDTIKDFESLLNAILEEIRKTCNASHTFVVVKQKDKEEPLVKVNNEATPLLRQHKKTFIDLAEEALWKGEILSKQNISTTVREIIAVPAIVGDDNTAVFGAINSKRSTGFSEEDRKLLIAVTKQADSALFEDFEKKKLKQVFGRYVSPDILNQILENKTEDYLKIQRREVSVLFSDLRGFTSLSEKLSPEKVVSMLNEYFATMTEIILANKGTIDKFVGDEIMAVFGAPVYFENHAARASKAAVEMQQAHNKLKMRWIAMGYPGIELGIGINSGEVVMGNIGCEQRTDFTVIGDNVNIAARLCSNAKPGQILVTEDTYVHIKKKVRAEALQPLPVKGKAEPLTVYNVVGAR